MKKKEIDNQNLKSFISDGVEIKGELLSQQSIKIDGTVDGKLEVKGSLVLGKTALIKGEIKVQNLILAGKIEGNIYASEKVDVMSTGQINGDVQCKVLTIEEGGILEGNSRMVKQESKIVKKEK